MAHKRRQIRSGQVPKNNRALDMTDYSTLHGATVLVPVVRHGSRPRSETNDTWMAAIVVGNGRSWGRDWIRVTPVQGRGTLCTSTFELLFHPGPIK